MNLTQEQLKQIIKEELEQVLEEEGLDELRWPFGKKVEPETDPVEQLKKDVELYNETASRVFMARKRQKDAKDLYHIEMIMSQARKENPQLKSIFDMYPEDKERTVLSRISQDDKDFYERWVGYKDNKEIYHDYGRFPGKQIPPMYSISRT